MKKSGETVFSGLFSRTGLAVLVCFFALGAFVSSCGRKSSDHEGLEKRVGYVDLPKVFESYEKIESFDKDLETLGKAKEDERNALVDDIRKLKDELSLLSEEGKVNRKKDYEEKMGKLEEFDTATHRELSTKRNELLKEVFDDIEKVVNDFADENGYDLVFSSRSLIFQRDQFDITSPVVRELNRRYERKAGTA